MTHTDIIIEAVEKWQSDPMVHPLTCGKDSGHRILEAVEENGTAVLKCPDCDYVQHWVPGVVVAHYSDHK